MADLKLSPDELRPLVKDIVAAVLAETEQARQILAGKLAIPEAEAAQLLDLNSWQLRDVRRAGKIHFHRIVGNRIRYTLDDLMAYLRQHRHEGNCA